MGYLVHFSPNLALAAGTRVFVCRAEGTKSQSACANPKDRMCGRSTYMLTWEEFVALYRLTLDQPPVNTGSLQRLPDHTTTPSPTVTGKPLGPMPMRWDLA